MQAWGGHTRRERASSVVGKLSAIVRRGSLFQADPEEPRGSSSRSSLKDDEPEPRSSTPTSSMTMWDPSASVQRFQFYPARPLVAAALARPLGEEELARRATLEAQMGCFAAVHSRFAPVEEAPDEQEEKEEAPEQPEMDNNQQETLEEQERRARDAGEGIGEASGAFAEDEALLEFDSVNMTASVRMLMSRIKSESFISEFDVPAECATAVSNQDEEDEEVDRIDNVDDLGLDNNAERDSSSDGDASEAQVEQELVPELSPAQHHLLQRRRTRLLSCAAEQAALSTHDQLTSSVRRLVIQLKDDSDRLRKPLAQSQGIRRNTVDAAPMRRRAGSCPMPFDASGDLSPPSANTPLQPSISPPLVSEGSHSSKKHFKKSAFARIGPRVLETLHLRKKRKTYLFTDQELETIEGARWKIVELAFRFGGKHRTYLVQAINMFFPLLKYGRRGGAHATRLHCNCCGTLQWQHKRGGLSEAVDLAGVLHVLEGRQTAVFRKYASNTTLEACSFSVVFRGRTLDLETQSSSHRDWLVSALRTLVAYARRQRQVEQQAIAERAILPLDDDVVPSRSTVPLSHRRRQDPPVMAALPPNYTIRTVY